MKAAAKLVDLQELRALIAALELGDPKRNEYITARWLKYVEWWDSRARGAKWKYFSLRGAVVIASALVPAFIGLRELSALGEGAGYSQSPRSSSASWSPSAPVSKAFSDTAKSGVRNEPRPS